MQTPLRFTLIGSGSQLIECAERLLARNHRIVGVLSDCPQVSAWAPRRGLALAPVSDSLSSVRARDEPSASTARREPYDYLLSIVHHAILPPELLATAEIAALNYHDSPLPEYAGFNATSWAILEGRTRHGVTWHRMTAEVDAGQVLVQPTFDIGDDDTAFTLSIKCSEAGIASFGELLDALEARALEGRPQGTGRSFHLRSERPDVALLELSQSARVLQRQVRALNFGPDDNWMCKPKLWLGARALAVTEASVELQHAGVAGTVLALDDAGLTLATGEGALRLTELHTLDGERVPPGSLATRFQLAVGQRLPAFDPLLLGRVRELDARLTKHERYWVKRLASAHAPRLSGLHSAGAEHGVEAQTEQVTRALPGALESLPWEPRRVSLISALAALVMRTGEGGPFDLGIQSTLADELSPFYASALPLQLEGATSVTFEGLSAQVRRQLDEQTSRIGFARDVVMRYRALRERESRDRALPIAVRSDGRAALVEGSLLTLSFDSTSARYTWVRDTRALASEAATRLFDRFEVLLSAGLATPDAEVRNLALLPAAERTLLLERFQDTRVPYASERTVHALFEEQVDRTPDRTALLFREQALSYRELDQRANRVAHALRARGVGPEVLVGLCVERSLDMVVGLLAILKAGGAYVPLDPVYPRERIAMMLEDAKAKVLLTQESLASTLPPSGAEVLYIERLSADTQYASERPRAGAVPDNLAYVIFTSGSTGRPKGVMVLHRNASNFFTGMDRALAHDQPGRWLAVTSISFDISVLELFWTLTRGFEVVVQQELDRASLAKSSGATTRATSTPMAFGLFYFAAETGSEPKGGAYRLLLEGARFADEHDFAAVWTPERHFHAFGGLYPNPAVTTAALATITKRVQLRAGSIVLPLHNPLRVAEDWAVIDHLSGGRIGLSFASGWHVNDFAFMPENYERRREIMLESIDTVQRLWRGEKVAARSGTGAPIEVSVLPRPLNSNPPIWVASAGNVETFQLAGRLGFNVLTNMLGQDLSDLRNKLAAYREARRAHGHAGDGIVSVMLHTFVCEDTERARELARRPFSNYLASSFDLVKVAPWMFPAFKQPSKASASDAAFDPASFTGEDMQALLDHAFDRYFDTAGLFGSPEHALAMVEQLKSIGANEVACLVDFGIETEEALRGLVYLDKLRQLSNPTTQRDAVAVDDNERFAVGAQLSGRAITHLQCTPSTARMLLSDPEAVAGLRGLKKLMLGGEALPRDLLDELSQLVEGEIVNMYGPTETTVWSTTKVLGKAGEPITIGRPIANTIIRILDAHLQPLPIGVAGELCIGGAGVVRGYLDRPDLTGERFVQDPCDPDARIYRTGDLARFREDGEIEFLGRLDHQVKVNGYRIELGEIESALGRHPGVRQNVVVARSDHGPLQLVAYVVSSGASSARDDASAQATARVDQWKTLWDETYKLAHSEPSADASEAARDPRFNIAGWRDSFSGLPIPAEEMREWLDATSARVLEHGPKRVLELGCGTGMILYSLLPHVEHYTAVDVSPHALETIRAELTPEERAKVLLLQRAAHELEGVQPRSFDTVIINSVAQYFPNADYLTEVLRQASELVCDGGRIFVGDVRNLAHLEAFHTRAELTQAPAQRSAAELVARIDKRVRSEAELLLSESYFEQLPETLARVAAVDVRLKRGLANNEMAAFRFDALLHVGVAPASFALEVAAQRGLATLDEVAHKLTDRPALLWLSDLRNARLSGVYGARAKLSGGAATVSSLRDELASADGLCPEALMHVHPDYRVDLLQARSSDPARFDAVLRHRQSGPQGRPLVAPRHEHPVANQPARAADAGTLFQELREQLRQTLPEYMIPAHFVELAALPLTPNGKIDRKALPAPQTGAPRAAIEFAPPSSDLEQQIAGVWQSVLQLEQVGRDENIFDLGANSLLTVQAANRLSGQLGRKVSLVGMFRFPTVSSLAAHLAAEQGGTTPSGVKRADERDERRKDAAERRRQLRAGRASQGVRDD
jgi:natural product biosynthesis luciferase-like monooxygenase protein